METQRSDWCVIYASTCCYWGDTEGISSGSCNVKVFIYLEFYTTIQGTESDIERGDSILTLTTTFSRVMQVSTGANVSYASSIEQSAMISGHSEVVVVTSILEDDDVVLMEADRVSLRKDLRNVGTVECGHSNHISESAGRNLVNLSGHIYLILILLPRVVILRSLHQLFLALLWLYYHGRSMIDSAS